jgi:hypothetical protein
MRGGLICCCHVEFFPQDLSINQPVQLASVDGSASLHEKINDRGAIVHLIKNLSGARSFTVLLVTYLIFVVLLMPGLASSAVGPGPLDLLFSYSPAEAFARIESYGEAGRQAYAIGSLTLDTAYPLIYTALFMVMIMQLTRGPESAPNPREKLALIPLATLLFDLAENLSIVSMLMAYPQKHEWVAELASLFTSLKWVSAGITIALVIVLLVVWVVGFSRRSKLKDDPA